MYFFEISSLTSLLSLKLSCSLLCKSCFFHITTTWLRYLPAIYLPRTYTTAFPDGYYSTKTGHMLHNPVKYWENY